MAESAPLLATRQLEVTYNYVQKAIQGVSVDVPARRIVALLGTNGAGKTTSLRAINGFLPSDYATISEGQVTYEGQTLNGRLPHAIANLGIVLVPERDKVFTTLTVLENLQAIPAKGSPGSRSRTLELIYELFPVLAERRRQVAGYLSGGERQMLAIANALLLQPRVLLVDELSFGLAPVLVGRLMATLRRINEVEGTAILLVEQNAAAALAVADYAYIMETGRVVLEGTPEMLMNHAQVQEFYLGMSEGTGVRSYADVKQYRRKRRWWSG